MAIKRACKTVFCRADNLARTLEHMGVDARCAGNVMMDTIPHGDYDAAARRTRPLAVTLLPGSRALTAESFALQVDALRTLPPDLRPDVFRGGGRQHQCRRSGQDRPACGAPPMLSAESDDLGELSDGDLTIHMARGGAMGNLLAARTWCCRRRALRPSRRWAWASRPSPSSIRATGARAFDDEQMLFGEARTVRAAEGKAIGAALRTLLADDEERAAAGQYRPPAHRRPGCDGTRSWMALVALSSALVPCGFPDRAGGAGGR